MDDRRYDRLWWWYGCQRRFVQRLFRGITAVGCLIAVGSDQAFGGSTVFAPYRFNLADQRARAQSVGSELNKFFLAGQNALGDRLIAQNSPAPVPEGLLPLGEELPSPAEFTLKKSHPTIPASKMTIRTEPGERRLNDPQQLDPEAGAGKTLKAIQDEIESNENGPEFTRRDFLFSSLYTWEGELPYGKYIYIHHAPLLFEDIPLERYGEGHGHCVQPVISFFKFVGTVPLLPYKIPVDYWAANHYDQWYSFDQYGNVRPGITEGQFFPFGSATGGNR